MRVIERVIAGAGLRSVRCTVILLMGAALAAPAGGFGQGGAPLLRDDAVRLFLERNPELDLARNEVERVRAGQVGARLRPNPELTVTAENFRLSGAPSFGELYEVSASYSETIELGGKRGLRSSVADLEVSAAEATLEAVLRQGVFDIEELYLEAVLSRERRDIAMEARTSIAELLEVNEIRLEEGVVSEGDVIRLRLETLSIDRAVRNATLAFEQATIRLTERLGGTDFDAWTVTGGLDIVADVPDLDLLRETALIERPELGAARIEVDRAEESVALARAEAVPNLQPFVGYKRVASSNAVLFGVSLPLNFRNRNQGGIERALAEHRSSQSQAVVLRNRVFAEVESAYRSWQSASEQVARFEQDLLADADDAREISRIAYDEGVAELITLLDAEGVRADVRTGYSEARFDYALSILELERATGRDIEQ